MIALSIVQDELRGHHPGVTLEISPVLDEIIVRDADGVLCTVGGLDIHKAGRKQTVELFRREVAAAYAARKAAAK